MHNEIITYELKVHHLFQSGIIAGKTVQINNTNMNNTRAKQTGAKEEKKYKKTKDAGCACRGCDAANSLQ